MADELRRGGSAAARRALPLAAAGMLLACGSSGPTVAPLPTSAVPRSAIEPVVARDAVLFGASEVPPELDALLGGARILLFGEVHYVEEHQRFLVQLLPRLHAAGVRTLLQEDMHATAWASDEYARLRSDVLPEEPAAFDRILLDGLRAFNATLAEQDRIGFAATDVNHWTGLFPRYLALFQDRFGTVAALAPLLAAPPDGTTYAAALEALPGTLRAQEAALRASLGPARYDQLLELVEVERLSLGYRRSQDAAAREGVIRDRILAAVAAASGAPVAVNTGLWHAQKARQFPPAGQPVGAWLRENPAAYGGDPRALRAILFASARGAYLASFRSPAAVAFDAVDSDPNDVTRILAERAGGQAALLPFADAVFAGAPLQMKVAVMVEVVQPAQLFDAMVLYPTATVLASLAPYR